ncbi:hypothetical protein BJ875DRAFT_454476 [Amylocarpus encephaloides]|uniref:Uncharacterized protein n=1 Tax=Amylocarpus encephaloides TaxID=45428 RepID=A0A9P7YP58_9HELO|nr:hypothetical protein BJ875DRAFT_454476 [Amylocarpus encephaloides]
MGPGLLVSYSRSMDSSIPGRIRCSISPPYFVSRESFLYRRWSDPTPGPESRDQILLFNWVHHFTFASPVGRRDQRIQQRSHRFPSYADHPNAGRFASGWTNHGIARFRYCDAGGGLTRIAPAIQHGVPSWCDVNISRRSTVRNVLRSSSMDTTRPTPPSPRVGDGRTWLLCVDGLVLSPMSPPESTGARQLCRSSCSSQPARSQGRRFTSPPIPSPRRSQMTLHQATRATPVPDALSCISCSSSLQAMQATLITAHRIQDESGRQPRCHFLSRSHCTGRCAVRRSR